MFKFHTIVPASQIWETAEDHEDYGPHDSLVRGYNVEVRLKDGRTEWWSCEWIHGDPEFVFNDDFHTWMWKETYGVELTGRISFRGYGREVYDPYEHEEFVIPVSDDQAKKILKVA